LLKRVIFNRGGLLTSSAPLSGSEVSRKADQHNDGKQRDKQLPEFHNSLLSLKRWRIAYTLSENGQ
jgi:hypothetical protein